MTEIEYLMICLCEECSEVSQRINKAQRFGLDEIQPGQPDTNARRIALELADLQGVVQELQARGVLPMAGLIEATERKKKKLQEYMDYSRKLGILEQKGEK